MPGMVVRVIKLLPVEKPENKEEREWAPRRIRSDGVELSTVRAVLRYAWIFSLALHSPLGFVLCITQCSGLVER